MKISEMNTDQLSDALVELTDPISNIAKDEELNKALNELSEKRQKKEITMPFQEGLSIIKAFVPALLKRHRQEVYAVLAALTGKSAAEIAGQNGFKTILEARHVIDKELIDFFKSSGT